MFGPDKCGTASKVHFIFRREHPVTKEITEHHITSPPAVPTPVKDGDTHSFGLLMEGTKYTIYTDGIIARSGDLNTAKQFSPDLFDATEIDDPTDVKPPQEEWDERDYIADPEAKKPEGWDDISKEIADPAASKPDDWDDEMDGEWEAPVIPNPDFIGEWTAPLIKNPAYKGKWTPRRIANPKYFDFASSGPHKSFLPVDSLGFELWTMDGGIVIDNVYVGAGAEISQKLSTLSRHYFEPRHAAEHKQLAANKLAAQGAVSYTISEIIKLARENPILAALAGVGSLLPILLVCFMCTGSSSAPVPKKDKKKDKESPKPERKTGDDKKSDEINDTETDEGPATASSAATSDKAAEGTRKRKTTKKPS